MDKTSSVDALFDELGEDLAGEARAEIEAASVTAEHHGEQESDLSWLPGWYCQQMTRMDAEGGVLKKQLVVRLAQLDARRRAIRWRWGAAVKEEVDRQIREAGGKKKSIETEYGRCGYRTIPARDKVEIVDDAKAIDAAAFSCPDAIKKTLLVSVLLEHAKATGEELPGTRLVRTEPREQVYAGSDKDLTETESATDE